MLLPKGPAPVARPPPFLGELGGLFVGLERLGILMGLTEGLTGQPGQFAIGFRALHLAQKRQQPLVAASSQQLRGLPQQVSPGFFAGPRVYQARDGLLDLAFRQQHLGGSGQAQSAQVRIGVQLVT